MNIGIVGLGRMGNAIAYRLLNGNHSVFGFDTDETARKHAKEMGVSLVDSIHAVAGEARIIWLMVPIEYVDDVLQKLTPRLKAGDIVIDGGNSFYKDSMRRAKQLYSKGITYLDCGTSGGIKGREQGFCLMVGGDEDAYVKTHSILEAIAAPGGICYVGPSGTGHYVKMVHNGIEYGLLQAYAEGFDIIKNGTFKNLSLDLEKISRVWNESSIIRSFILGLAHDVFEKDQELHAISGSIQEGGTGKWTMEEAYTHDIPAPMLREALATRAWSRETGGNYTTKVIAMLRKEFGGHAVEKNKENHESD